jgi:hypothetical protein
LNTLYVAHFVRLYSFEISTLEIKGTFDYVTVFDLSPDETKVVVPAIYMLRLNIVSSVINNNDAFSFSLSPNPIREQALLNIPPQGMRHVEIQLLTIEGSVVGHLFSGTAPEPISIPFLLYEYPHLANRQYFLQMIVDGQPQESLTFIIQR